MLRIWCTLSRCFLLGVCAHNSCNLAWNHFAVLNILSGHWHSCIWDALNLLTGNFAGVGVRHCIVWNKNPFQMAPRELSLLPVRSCHRWALVTGVVSSCAESLPLQLVLFLLMSLLCQKKKRVEQEISSYKFFALAVTSCLTTLIEKVWPLLFGFSFTSIPSLVSVFPKCGCPVLWVKAGLVIRRCHRFPCPCPVCTNPFLSYWNRLAKM